MKGMKFFCPTSKGLHIFWILFGSFILVWNDESLDPNLQVACSRLSDGREYAPALPSFPPLIFLFALSQFSVLDYLVKLSRSMEQA